MAGLLLHSHVPVLSAKQARGTNKLASIRAPFLRRSPHPLVAHTRSRVSTARTGCIVYAVAQGDATPKAADAAKSEDSAYKKREEESKAAGIKKGRAPRGGDPPPEGRWQWTLNWDPITESADGVWSDGETEIIVGSCPKTAKDLERLHKEAGVEAILSMQSDVCLDAMGVEFESSVYPAAVANNILYVRLPVYDFDRIDQAAMLPEMVRKLALLVATGRRTYVHCTAGINRANLAVLGYFTFVKGMQLDAALKLIKESRPQANPYVECWNMSRERMLAGKQHDIYLLTQQKGNSIDEGGDWIMRDWEAASTKVIQDSYTRAIKVDLALCQTVARVSVLHPSVTTKKDSKKKKEKGEEEKKEKKKNKEKGDKDQKKDNN